MPRTIACNETSITRGSKTGGIIHNLLHFGAKRGWEVATYIDCLVLSWYPYTVKKCKF